MRVSTRVYHSEAQLAELEGPGLRFERGCCLEDLGRIDEAAAFYGALIAQEPGHFGALTNLGLLLLERDAFDAARPCLERASVVRPDDPNAYVNLARLEREAGNPDLARRVYERALALDPDHAEAHHGLGLLHESLGDAEAAAAQFARAFSKPVCWVLPYRGASAPVRALLLVSARGGDLVTNLFLDDTVFATYMFPVESYRAGLALPPHDLVLCALGDADRVGDELERALAIVAASGAPVVNDPARIRLTGRAENAARFARLAGIVVPRVARVDRVALTADALAQGGWTFPLLLRAPGLHGGRRFERVDSPRELPQALARLVQRELLAISFLDVRSADGYHRKYRVLFVGGRLYPVHLAVATDWNVHAFSADVDGEAQLAEERAFLGDPIAVLGPRASAALFAIHDALGLDYAGVDFSLDPDGNVVIFEANATMAVYPPAESARPERSAACARVVRAMRDLLLERALRRA